MNLSKGVNMVKVNSTPRHIHIEISTKIEKHLEEEISEYHVSKNSEYQHICRETGEEYGNNHDRSNMLISWMECIQSNRRQYIEKQGNPYTWGFIY